jgi:hypothetical protein
MTKEKIKQFKTYYITCYLLSKFTGICSMFAEEELFEDVYTFVKTGAKDTLIDKLDFMFGLSKKDLNQAVKDYDNYLKEKKELDL